MKNRKQTIILIFVLAAFFEVLAVIGFVTGQVFGFICLIMGSALALLGIAAAGKLKKDAEESDGNEGLE